MSKCLSAMAVSFGLSLFVGCTKEAPKSGTANPSPQDSGMSGGAAPPGGPGIKKETGGRQIPGEKK